MPLSLVEQLKEIGILPSISETIQPAIVSYASVQVDCGKEITPRQAASQPRISWEAEESSFYTVMFIDPDVPRRTSRRRCHCKHWLVVNVPGNAVEKGHTEAEYFGPGPGRGSGLHRYTFLVFKQQGKLPESATVPRNELKGRFFFETTSFAEEYKLTLVAANYLQAGYDSSVPQLYRSFAGCSVVFKNICPLINVAFRVGI